MISASASMRNFKVENGDMKKKSDDRYVFDYMKTWNAFMLKWL